MARRIENTKSYRRRRLATRIRAIKEAIRKRDCDYAELLLTDTMLSGELDRYSISMRQSSFASLRKQINHCHRRKHGFTTTATLRRGPR